MVNNFIFFYAWVQLSFQMWTNQMQETLNSKKKGDVAFRHKDFGAAIECYTQVFKFTISLQVPWNWIMLYLQLVLQSARSIVICRFVFHSFIIVQFVKLPFILNLYLLPGAVKRVKKISDTGPKYLITISSLSEYYPISSQKSGYYSHSFKTDTDKNIGTFVSAIICFRFYTLFSINLS